MQEPLNILFMLDNCLWKLDEQLYQVYNQKNPSDPLPSLSDLFASNSRVHGDEEHSRAQQKQAPIKKNTLHKLFNLMTQEGFFSSLPCIDTTRQMLQEMYAYEQQFPNHIHLRVVTSLNPALHSIFFLHSRDCWDFRYMDSGIMSRVMSEKLALIEAVLGARQLWLDRVIFIDQKQDSLQRRAILFSDADIVVQPFLHNYARANMNQKQIIYLRDGYNLTDVLTQASEKRGVKQILKLKHWKKVMCLHLNLEQVLPTQQTTNDTPSSVDQQNNNNATSLDDRSNVLSFIHGSTDSNDIDKLYMFPDQLPPHTECLKFIHSSGTEDRNLFSIAGQFGDEHRKGYVNDAFKGLIDEVNNALFTTYPLHKQDHPCPIMGKAQRIVPLKVCMTLLNLLIKTRRADPYRELVVKALNSWDFETRRQAVSAIDFGKIEHKITEEDTKYCAFRLGQTIALIHGREVYTKADLCRLYEDLRPLIYRENSVSNKQKMLILNKYKEQFINAIADVRVEKRGSLHLFKMKRGTTVSNYFHVQANGTIVDLKDQKLRCLFYGFNSPTSGSILLRDQQQHVSMVPDWPTDAIHPDCCCTTTTAMEEDDSPIFIPIQIFEYNYVRKSERNKSSSASSNKKDKKDKKNKKKRKKKQMEQEEEHPEDQSNHEEAATKEENEDITVKQILISTNETFEALPELKKLQKILDNTMATSPQNPIFMGIHLNKCRFNDYFYTFLYDGKRQRLELCLLRNRLTNLLESSESSVFCEMRGVITSTSDDDSTLI